MPTTRLFVFALLAACSSEGSDPGSDASVSGDGGGSNMTIDGGGSTDGGGSNRVMSTLTSSCGATLQGRAVVNYNGNLGVAFTEDDSPYTFLGSVSFELPAGFTGAVPNPEGYNGSNPRKVVALSDASFGTYGNHCWFNGTMPSGGSVTVTTWRPDDGVVKATFNQLPLRSCTGAAICTVSGTIETTGEGVFE